MLHLSPSGSSVTGAQNFYLDEAVIAQFPPEARVISADIFGSSAWTTTACIAVELADGTTQKYYYKCASGDEGRANINGEFAAMVELHKTLPSFVANPVASGNFHHGNTETNYFFCEFVDLKKQNPEPRRLCTNLAELHRRSISPTGCFGFHVRTFNGKTAQAIEWNKSWASFFTQMISHVISLDFETNGYWEELDKIEQKILTVVIPRLLGILETEGRSIKPCLLHGNLWEGNTGTSYDTGDVYIFDGASFYGHNEMEIGDWRCPYNKIHSKIYTKTYLRHYGMSEPVEEWDDRNRMYSVYYNIIYSVNHKGQGSNVRQM